jgi:lysophospholipase L1-like esterase
MTGLISTAANDTATAGAVAVLLVAVPLLAAVLLGRALRHWRWSGVAGVFAILSLTLACLEGLRQVGAWDTVAVGLFAATGFLLGGARLEWRGGLVLALSSALAAAMLETAARSWLPPPPHFPDAAKATLIFEPAAWDAGCAVLYTAESVDDDVHVLRRPQPNRKSRQHPRLVVHLGDSMTYGEGVRGDETFPALLDARQPTALHRNYGVWAVGTDFEYLLLQRILAEHSPSVVVLHVYVGNDIRDIDRPYACCEAGPLLDYAADGPIARCESAQWSFPLAYRLSRSPPPFPLRVAASWSYAARHAAAAFSRLTSRLEPGAEFILSEGEASQTDWEHFTQILATLHDGLPPNVELIVNLLPNRQALEMTDPKSSPSYRAAERIAEITARFDIRTIDAWDVLATAVKRDGARRYFRDQDIHFTPEGHRLLADWLEAQLPSAPPVDRR